MRLQLCKLNINFQFFIYIYIFCCCLCKSFSRCCLKRPMKWYTLYEVYGVFATWNKARWKYVRDFLLYLKIETIYCQKYIKINYVICDLWIWIYNTVKLMRHSIDVRALNTLHKHSEKTILRKILNTEIFFWLRKVMRRANRGYKTKQK